MDVYWIGIVIYHREVFTMSDWCAWIEGKMLEAKKLLVDDMEINDEEFDRIILQLRRMRRGTWKKGQI